MVKQAILSWSLFPLLFYSLQYSLVHSTLFLQIGDKCFVEEKSSINNLFSVYDDSGALNLTSVNGAVDSSHGSDATNIICDPAIPLECLSGRCQCKKGYTINRNGTKCLEVARNGLDSTCEENIQCWKSLLGRMSECNADTGKCQCYESETLPIVFHQGRCYYGESLGEYCQIEGLCEATTPNATCRSGGTCQCKEGYVPSWDKSRCLPIATEGLDSPCEENVQCEKSQLGALSECDQKSMRCNCYKIPDMDTLFHGGKCYFEAALGDVCFIAAQCQKKTQNAVCSRDGKCFCDEGYIPNGNNTLCFPIPSSDGAAAGKGEEAENGANDGDHGANNDSNNNNSNIHSHSNNGQCYEDSQCFRVLGPFSRCNIGKQKCECHVSENFYLRLNHHYHHNYNHNNYENSVTTAASVTSSKNSFSKLDGISDVEQLDLYDHSIPSLVMVGSRCFLGRFIGQTCKFNKQCSAVTENSWCDNGRCECLDETHVRSEDERKCLKIAQKGLDSVCDEDAQCAKSELGPLSRCNLDKKRCECSNNIMPVVYFKGQCFFHRQLGTSCQTNAECQAGSNYLAECSIGRCRCQNGTVRLSPHICGFISPVLGNDAMRSNTSRTLLLLVALASLFSM